MQSFILKIVEILLSVVTTIALTFSPITQAIANINIYKAKSFETVDYEDQLVPELDEDGCWTFTTDRDLKVVQITDVHIGGGFASVDEDAKALNAVAAMLTAEKPDLVVFTGDMVFPVPIYSGRFHSGTFNNSISTNMLITLMEQLGIYYTVCLGNHDSEIFSTHTREQISDIWADEGLKYSLYQEGPEDVDGFGNHLIKVKNTQGIVKNVYFMFDSHSYTDDDIFGNKWLYDNIHENQIQWYKDAVLAIDRENKLIDPACPMFTSLAFLHIALEEYGIAWDELRANGYEDTADVKYFDGWYHEDNEKSYCGVEPENLFETMLELGSTKGVFCGHDHYNNATIEYKGIRLTYGMCLDYLTYDDVDKLGSQRGCTVITLTQDGDLSVSLENYYQDKYPSKYEKEEVTMQWKQQ